MKFRFTIEELNTKSDIDILKAILNERMSELNVYSPLYKRLTQLYAKLGSKKTLTTTDATGEIGYIGYYLKAPK